MSPNDRKYMLSAVLLLLPILTWLAAVQSQNLGAMNLWQKIVWTAHDRFLLLSFLSGVGGSVLLFVVYVSLKQQSFAGAPFNKHLRGTKIVNTYKLQKKTQESAKQVYIADIPIPTAIENLHLLLNGATGTGKTVLLRELVSSAMNRGDQMIIIDPNSNMLSRFYQPQDIILNPYDNRTAGWSFFNEIQNDFDFQRYALSIVPRGRTDEAEEWAGYSRLLLRETAKKLVLIGTPSVRELFYWTTMAPYTDLKNFLSGTMAESLFSGADEASRALTSARFILSDKLPEHITMPQGVFSIRQWLKQGKGNLFITWQEDMAVALKPLISSWVDVVCTSVLSLPENEQRHLWLVIDELASLDKLASLEAALTRGRKHGLRMVAGLQSTSQLDDIYGTAQAQTLRSCFRSLVVLGGARTDPKTNEDMSLSLGEHEVERIRYGRNSGDFYRGHRDNVTETTEWVKERVVSPAEISNLPSLQVYISFAGNRPIAKVAIKPIDFEKTTASFIEREVGSAQS